MDYIVSADDSLQRLDLFLTEKSGLTRSRVQALIREGHVSLSGEKRIKPGSPLKPGMAVSMELPQVRPARAAAENIPLRILYQDSDLAVVYKPSGMVVHPAPGNYHGTLVNALLYHIRDLSGIGGEMRPGIVHRIDKDTSGLLLVAKNDRSHVSLAEQIKAHSLKRAYIAVLAGNMKEDSGSVNAPIGRHPKDRKKMAVVPNGRSAQTDWRVLERYSRACLIEARLHTGRTHQIRVHMASIGHPVIGDPLYAPGKPLYAVKGGQLLHAWQLGFVHPSTGREMLFEAGPEERFQSFVDALRRTRLPVR